MKKIITTIVIFLVGIILGIFIKSEYDSVKSKKVVVKQTRIQVNNATASNKRNATSRV